MCSESLHFQMDMTLEELILRQAFGMDFSGATRDQWAQGVMMIPIPVQGVIKGVAGLGAADEGQGVGRGVPGAGGQVQGYAPGRLRCCVCDEPGFHRSFFS